MNQNKNQRKPISQNRTRAALPSYYHGQPSKNGSQSPFIRKQPKRKLKGYVYGLTDIIVAAVLISGLIYSLLIQPNPKINANDTSFHSLNDYRAAAAAQLSHLDNRNKITFNQGSLALALKKQFPEIQSVNVELPLFSQQPTISLAIDKAALFLDSQGIRYIVDSSGLAVAKAASLPEIKNLPVVSDSSGFRTNTGQQILSSDGVRFIKTVLAECGRAGVKVSSLTLPAVPQELDLRASGQSYFVKFFIGGDALTQIGQYLATRHHFAGNAQPPSQYLDVRVLGKVFYK